MHISRAGSAFFLETCVGGAPEGTQNHLLDDHQACTPCMPSGPEVPLRVGKGSGTWSHEEPLRAVGLFGPTGTALCLSTFPQPARRARGPQGLRDGKPHPACLPACWGSLAPRALVPGARVMNKRLLLQLPC